MSSSSPLEKEGGRALEDDDRTPLDPSSSVGGVQEEANKREAKGLVGQRLGKYRLDALLGMGGWASVFAATHRNGNRVALKLLHERGAGVTHHRERFLREGHLANKIRHPAIPRVLDDGVTEDGRVYLIMELLQGETLHQRVARKGQLPSEEGLVIVHQLLEVLDLAHERGIVHRDIKPGNIFISANGRVNVLDFGVARMRQVTSKSLTRTGQLLGTPSYMPPEQARGRFEDVDERSDLWSAGATLHFMLTGRDVHEADTVNEVLLAAMTNEPRPIRDLVPDLPEHVADVVDQALKRDKDERWQSATAMRRAVATAYHTLTGRDVQDSPPLFVPAQAVESVMHAASPARGSQAAEDDVPLRRAGDAASVGSFARTLMDRVPKRRGLFLGGILLAGGVATATALAISAQPSSAPRVQPHLRHAAEVAASAVAAFSVESSPAPADASASASGTAEAPAPRPASKPKTTPRAVPPKRPQRRRTPRPSSNWLDEYE